MDNFNKVVVKKVVKKVVVKKVVKCPVCNGVGQIDDVTCAACGGTGNKKQYNQVVASLSNLDQKRQTLIDDIDHLQKIKEEQTKQIMSEIAVLTRKRNFLLKQTKELFEVVETLKQKRDRVTKDIDTYVNKRMEETGVVGPLKIETKTPTEISSGGIIK